MENSQKVTTNIIWRFLERCGAQLVAFIVSLVLARILEPETYGIVVLISVFTAILSIFMDSGLGTALIQKKDADDVDFSTVFYFNIVMGLIFYLIMFLIAPVIASFYNNEQLSNLIRVQSLILLIGSVKNVQQAFVSRKMIFKKFFFATIGGTVGAGILGVVMASNGFGVWALICQSLFNNTIDTIILWFTVKWRPKWKFSFIRLKSLYRFGWKLLVSALIDTVYSKLRQFVIGKIYTPSDLAFYEKGEHFPNFIVSNINSSINSVLLPAMSNYQNDILRLKEMTRKSIKVATYIMMPMMVGLAVCSENVVTLLLTEKWLPCVFFMRIFCFTFAFYPIHVANLNAIQAVGRSDIFLKLEIIKKIIGLLALIATMFVSVKAMAMSLLITSVCSQIVNSWPNKKLLNYSYIEQLKDIFPQMIASVAMGCVVFCEKFIPTNIWIKLPIQIISGIIMYYGLSKLFKLDSFDYIKKIISSLKRKNFF